MESDFLEDILNTIDSILINRSDLLSAEERLKLQKHRDDLAAFIEKGAMDELSELIRIVELVIKIIITSC